MKTTLKKTINNFDESYVQNDKDIYDSSDIDIEKITRNVKMRIAAESKTHRRKPKKLPLMLIAAAVSVAIVGTTVAAVALNRREDFSEIISGESEALEVYTNDSFRFETTDDNLQAELLGMTGTEKNAYACFEVSTKDGSPINGDFDGYIKPDYKTFSSEEEYNNYIKIKADGIEKIKKEDSEYNFKYFQSKPFSDLDNPEEYLNKDGINNPDYSRYWQKKGISRNGEVIVTKDDKFVSGIDQDVYLVPGETPDKMKMYLRLKSDKSLIGTTVEVKSDYYNAYKLSDTIAEAIEASEDETDEIILTYRLYDYGSLLKYPSYWDTSDGTYKLRKADYIKRYSLPFKASFTIDKLTTNKAITIELNSKNAPNSIKNDETISITLDLFSASGKISTKNPKIVKKTIEDKSNNIIGNETPKLIEIDKIESSISFDNNYTAEIIQKNGNRYYFDLKDIIDFNNYDTIEDYNLALEKRELFTSSYRDTKENVSNDIRKILLNDDMKISLNQSEKLQSELNKCSLPLEKVIDPTSIKEIIINGDTVYQAE